MRLGVIYAGRKIDLDERASSWMHDIGMTGSWLSMEC